MTEYTADDYQKALDARKETQATWLNDVPSDTKYTAYAQACDVLTEIAFSLGKTADEIVADIRKEPSA